MRTSQKLARVLASLSEEEAVSVYNALAQWADNECNGLEECGEPDPDHEKSVSTVEAVVNRLEIEIVA